MLQRYHGGDSDENACSGPGNGKDGHVQQNFHIFYNEAGYENLAEVMKNAAGSRYANETEFATFLEDEHAPETEGSPGYTVEKGIDSSAKSSGKNDAKQENQGDIPFPGKSI